MANLATQATVRSSALIQTAGVPGSEIVDLLRGMPWSREFAKGCADGHICRERGGWPTKFHLIAFDGYSQGFRTGFFQR